ncbi:MAG: type II toxin-antitoxin system ParD family antitoxin [Bacteroidales bacterium]|nr:type II toxin-antitoxin system ParD family antitoxin [Bacteroidales bacterium]
MEGFKTKIATDYKTVSYNEISEQIKLLPDVYLGDLYRYISYLMYCARENEERKIQNLRAAIKEGEESGFLNDFDPDAFLQKIKSERHDGKI